MPVRNAKKIAYIMMLSPFLCSGFLPIEAKDEWLPNPDNLIIEGVPAVPLNVVSGCEKYTHFRQAVVSSWHPVKERC